MSRQRTPKNTHSFARASPPAIFTTIHISVRLSISGKNFTVLPPSYAHQGEEEDEAKEHQQLQKEWAE
jgi:hypothetical protein